MEGAGKFIALSIFNISREVTSAKLPGLAEPSRWTVGQALHLPDTPFFLHRTDGLDGPLEEAWTLWRVTRSPAPVCWPGGLPPCGPSPGPGSSRAGASDYSLDLAFGSPDVLEDQMCVEWLTTLHHDLGRGPSPHGCQSPSWQMLSGL